MNIRISDEIKSSATSCTKDFSCLSPEKKDLCKVKKCVDEKVHFIECNEHEYCTYKISFGTEFFCSCPVRKEIYNKHRI